MGEKEKAREGIKERIGKHRRKLKTLKGRRESKTKIKTKRSLQLVERRPERVLRKEIKRKKQNKARKAGKNKKKGKKNTTRKKIKHTSRKRKTKQARRKNKQGRQQR